MKDEQARKSVQRLQERVFGPMTIVTSVCEWIGGLGDRIEQLRSDAWRWYESLDRRMSDLERTTKVLDEKDCPVCGRKTLMKKLPVLYTWVEALTVTHKPDTFYCYSCGKTFKEVETKALVEVTQ